MCKEKDRYVREFLVKKVRCHFATSLHFIGVFAIVNRVCLSWREIRGILTMLSLFTGQSMRMGFFEIMPRGSCG